LDLRYFDCSWVSDYPSEEEKLLIGGDQQIRVFNIIHCRLGHNYKHYVAAIGIIQNMFDARHNPNKKKIDAKTRSAVRNLLNYQTAAYDDSNNNPQEPLLHDVKSMPRINHILEDEEDDNMGPALQFGGAKKSVHHNKAYSQSSKAKVASRPVMPEIPEYIQELFAYFCKNWDKTIRIDIQKFNNSKEYNEFNHWVIDTEMAQRSNLTLVKIDVICKIFQNVRCIEIVNGFIFTNETLLYLFRLLTMNATDVFNKLTEIRIENSSQADHHVKQLLMSQQFSFARNSWQWDLEDIHPPVAHGQGAQNQLQIQQSKYAVFVKNNVRPNMDTLR